MPTETIIIVGAGDQGKVVLDAILRGGASPGRIRVVDGDPSKVGREILGFEVHPEGDRQAAGYAFHIAVGGCRARQLSFERHLAAGGRPLSVVHPDATISRFSTIDEGSFVAARAVVGPSASVARGAIINHGAVVDHACVIGEFCHVAPNATLGGTVKVGARVMVGASATVLPGVTIGDDSVIGAGAVVLHNVGPGETHVGVPAREIRRNLT